MNGDHLSDQTGIAYVPASPEYVFRESLKQPFTWVSAAASVMAALLAAGVITHLLLHNLTAAAVLLLNQLSTHLAASWRPPRVTWTERQRREHYAMELRRAGYVVMEPRDG